MSLVWVFFGDKPWLRPIVKVSCRMPFLGFGSEPECLGHFGPHDIWFETAETHKVLLLSCICVLVWWGGVLCLGGFKRNTTGSLFSWRGGGGRIKNKDTPLHIRSGATSRSSNQPFRKPPWPKSHIVLLGCGSVSVSIKINELRFCFRDTVFLGNGASNRPQLSSLWKFHARSLLLKVDGFHWFRWVFCPIRLFVQQDTYGRSLTSLVQVFWSVETQAILSTRFY